MRIASLFPLLMIAAMFIATVGCSATQVTDSPIVVDHAADDVDAEMAYWHGLTDRPTVSNNEALHGLILFINQADPAGDYEGRKAWLSENGYLSVDPGAGENVATLGNLAHILAQMLKIEGGLTMKIIGPHPRYAMRELVYEGIMTPGTSQQGISGIDFVGLLARAEAYSESQP